MLQFIFWVLVAFTVPPSRDIAMWRGSLNSALRFPSKGARRLAMPVFYFSLREFVPPSGYLTKHLDEQISEEW